MHEEWVYACLVLGGWIEPLYIISISGNMCLSRYRQFDLQHLAMGGGLGDLPDACGWYHDHGQTRTAREREREREEGRSRERKRSIEDQQCRA